MCLLGYIEFFNLFECKREHRSNFCGVIYTKPAPERKMTFYSILNTWFTAHITDVTPMFPSPLKFR